MKRSPRPYGVEEPDIAGLIFTLGMYAIKCGIGLAEGVVGHEKRRQSLLFAGSLIAHTLVFGGSYILLTRVDLLNQCLRVQEMARWFMTVHLLLATLLAPSYRGEFHP